MRASAGSGKTFNLARKYITLLFRKNDIHSYRNILAVTFTNKATDEMKSRILKELYVLSTQPEKSPYLKWFIPDMFAEKDMEGVLEEDIVRELPGKPGVPVTTDSLKQTASDILSALLHDYGAFSVSTIDKFFQQTLKAFSREIGHFSSYQVELDKKSLVKECVDRILDSLTEDDTQLLKWLTDFAIEQIENGDRYQLEQRLVEMAVKLKSDDHRMLVENSGVDESRAYSHDNLMVLRKECNSIIREFSGKVSEKARAILAFLQENALEVSHFYRGFLKILYNYQDVGDREEIAPLEEKFIVRCKDKDSWFSKANSKLLSTFNEDDLLEMLTEFCSIFQEEYKVYGTAILIRKQLYDLGVAADIYKEFDAVLRDRNVLSLDDSNFLLRNIIDGSDAPFVYEKTGVRYENFLLDEFQDTSTVQWDNFYPLLAESEGNGNDNLIVGDVKQSIYRWRGSDWGLLDNIVPASFASSSKLLVLDRNFRSCRNIVGFNNDFFRFAAQYLDSQYSLTPEQVPGGKTLADIYKDVGQIAASGSADEGNVRVLFCSDDQMSHIISSISSLRENGVSYGDIAILVRWNKEGTLIANNLVAEGIPVITDEALMVNSSITVRRLVSLLSYVDNPNDAVNSYLAGAMNVSVPEETHSISDLCEALCRRIRCYDEVVFDREVSYIQTFMDFVIDYESSNGNSLHDFLARWSEVSISVSSPTLSDAVRVMTVHKSKGLDFKHVIIPFSDKIALFKGGPKWCMPELPANYFPESERTPFDVNLTKHCVNTIFEEDLNKEIILQLVDNLNVFYVALTRAVKSMTIISSVPSKKFRDGLGKEGSGVQANSISDVLYEYLHFNSLSAGFEAEEIVSSETSECVGICFVKGKLSDEKYSPEQSSSVSKMDAVYPSYALNPEEGEESVFDTPDRSRLLFSSDALEYFTEQGRRPSTKIKGIVLHQILSKVNVCDDLEMAVNHAVVSGLIDSRDRDPVFSMLSEKLENIASYGWFSADNKDVRNETAIINTDGRIYRPDRITTDSKGTVHVIDYKFGEPDEKYLSQISRYANLLKRMGYENVIPNIWYVMRDEIV